MDKAFYKKFIAGLTATGFGMISQILLGLVSMIIAVRYLPKSDYGVYALLEVLVVLLAVLGSLGLENLSVVKLMAGADEERKALIANTAVVYRFLISLGLALPVLFLRPVIRMVFKSEPLAELTYFIAVFIILTGFQEIFMRLLQAYHRYRSIAVSQIISGVLRLGGVCLFIVAFKMRVTGLILAYLVTMVGSVVYLYSALPFQKKIVLDARIIRELFRFGLPLGLNNILSFIFMKIDRIMLGIMLSPVSVASYVVALRIPENIARMYTAFQAVYFPNVAELFATGKKTEAESVLNHSLRIISFMTLLAAFVGLLFQKEIMVLFFSAKYAESAPAFALLLFCFSIALTSDILGTSLVALGQSDKPVKINIVDSVLNVTGNLLLIPRFGVMGAVFATLVSRTVTNPFIVYFLRKAGVKIDFRIYLNAILIFLLAAAAVFLFQPRTIVMRSVFAAMFLGATFPYAFFAEKYMRKARPPKTTAFPPRVLILSNLYPPYIKGGHELQCQFAAEALAAKGSEVYVLTSRYGVAKPCQENNIFRLLHYYPEIRGMAGRLAAAWFARVNYFITRKAIKKVQPDLVYVGQLNGVSVVPLKAFRKRVPLVHHIGHFFYCELAQYCLQERHFIKRLLAKIVTGFYDRDELDFRNMIAVSTHIQNAHVVAGYPEKNIRVIPPMGVPVQNIVSEGRQALAPARRAIRLLFVGRLTRIKGVHLILDAIKLAGTQNALPDFSLRIIGDGDPAYITELKQTILENGWQDKTVWDGLIPPDQVVQAYDAADILLVPSLEEPFGLTIVEAMSRGLPVVAAAVGGITDIIAHEENGLLFETGDSQKLSREMCRLFQDAALYGRISRQAPETVRRKFSGEVVGEMLTAAIQNVWKADQ